MILPTLQTTKFKKDRNFASVTLSDAGLGCNGAGQEPETGAEASEMLFSR